MRLPMSRVYRAFPELDAFSDEQCAGFVRATKRRLGRRALRVLLQGIATVLGMACGAGVAWAYSEYVLGGDSLRLTDAAYLAMMAGVFVLVIGLGGAGWLVTRDVLLRRGIRRVLSTRGTCPACGYGLTGIPLVADGRVLCPECGFHATPDESLGEVQVNEAGVRLFMPSPEMTKAGGRVRTPEERRRLRTRITWALATPVVLLLVLALGYEVFIRWQAGVAARERPGAPGLVEFVLSQQPPGTKEGDPNAWDSFDQARMRKEQTDANTWRAAAAMAGADGVYPSFGALYDRSVSGQAHVDERNERGRVLAIDLLGQYRAAGVFDKLDEMATRPFAVRPITLPPGAPSLGMLLPELGVAREFARINAGRMTLALADEDEREWVSAYESSLAMSRILKSQILLLDWLVAFAIEALAFERLKDFVASRPDAGTVQAAEGAFVRQQSHLPSSSMIEGERLVQQDTIAWVFEDPSRVRLERWSRPLKAISFGSHLPSGRLGTYRSNLRAMDLRFAVLRGKIETEPHERTALAPADETNLLLMALLAPTPDRLIAPSTMAALHRRATRIMLALERSRLATGAYPATLAELDGLDADTLRDPWSGKTLGYRREGGGYVLYSAAADGVDDGGVFDPAAGPSVLVPGSIAGLDYLIHRQPGDRVLPTPREPLPISPDAEDPDNQPPG
ncbi:MAG: hypothetical protein SFY69_04960 [Planctomycetota bacterium]|nr:hypothetical protein [Planctomycetota bacterium]